MPDPGLPLSPPRRLRRVVAPLVLLLPLLLLWAARSYSGTSDMHSAVEVVGAVFGLIAGVTLLVRAIALDDRIHLFFGIGFFANASVDVVHGLLPFLALRGVVALPTATLDRFVPGSFLAGRLMLGGVVLAAPWLASRLGGRVRGSDAVRVGAMVVVAGAAVTVASFVAPLPRFLYPAQLFSRPGDLIVMLVFLAAAGVLGRAYLEDREPMTGWVVLAMLASAVGQVVISLSERLFDTPFFVAHLYKIISYALPLLGISLYQIRLQVHLEQAVERLRELDEAKTEFLSVVSHELKTPLTAVVGFSSLLEEFWDTVPEAQKREHVDAIRRQGSRLQSLIDDLLLVSSIQAGEIRAHQVDVNVAGHVASLTRGAELEGVETDVPDDLVVAVDPLHLRTMLQHLVANARKYGAGPVHVRAWTEGDEVAIAVDDAGPGIPGAIHDRLFREPFVQGDRGETRTSSGAGVGLAIVAGLVEANGGRPFHDVSPAGGARVGVRLPLVRREAPLTAPH